MCVSNTHKPYKEARCQTRGIDKGCVWRDGCCECIVGHYSRKAKDCLHRPVLQDGRTSTEVVHKEDEGESWEPAQDPSLSLLQLRYGKTHARGCDSPGGTGTRILGLPQKKRYKLLDTTSLVGALPRKMKGRPKAEQGRRAARQRSSLHRWHWGVHGKTGYCRTNPSRH